MTLSRKDYEAIARAIATAKPPQNMAAINTEWADGCELTRRWIATMLARYFVSTSTSFSSEWFMTICDLSE